MAGPVKYLSLSEWQQYVDQHPQATFYQTPKWYTVWDAYKGYKPHAVIITVKQKEVFFTYAVKRFKKGLLRKIISSPAGVYGGFLAYEPLTEEDLKKLVSYAAKLGEEVVITDANYNICDRKITTQTISLKEGIEDVRKGYAEAHPRKIEKAKKEGVTVKLAETDNDWDIYVGIYQQMLNEWDNPTMKYSTALFDKFKNVSGVKLWLAEYNGEIVGGALCLYHNNHVAYWHGAGNKAAKDVNANYVLFDAIMEEACKNGYEVFDMMPSAGLKGVEEFKSNFGAVPKEISLLVRTSKILKIFGHA